MRSRYRVQEKQQAYFVTATILEWLPVFNSSACCDLVLRSLDFCRERKGLLIYGWVILDSDLHAILAAPQLSAILRDWKSFTAQQILAQLPREGRDWLVNQLAYYRAAHKATGSWSRWDVGVPKLELGNEGRGAAYFRSRATLALRRAKRLQYLTARRRRSA